MVDAGQLPFFARGLVVAGFGRGSKELGIPTANYPEDVVSTLPDAIQSGIFYGWAMVDQGPVYKMVMSIGWNPVYQNKKRSMETHILHEFPDDFYGSQLSVCMVGFIRNEMNFTSKEELIEAIKNDIRVAEEKLSNVSLSQREVEFFSKTEKSQ
ncbi:putative riboflavin kinase [Dysidea avara]|uniref:putative riboflavin kinase n=1 Tax=Dysidea avara TaxID=196820 RepID=UPI00331FE3D1